MELASVSKILERLNDCPARDLESQSLEFKGWCNSEKDLSHEIGEAAVCLANTVGGLIIVGVDDKKTGATAISPCPHPSLTVDLVRKWIWDLTKPPVECNVVRLSNLLPSTLGLPMGDLFIVEIQKTSHASVVRHKSLYFDCHSERSEESRLFKYMRPFTSFRVTRK